MKEIFFPLASNINYFQSEERRLEIEAKVKQAILLFDRLCYEDGKYDFTVTEHGSWGGYTPPNLLTDQDAEFKYFDRPVRNKPVNVTFLPERPDGTPVWEQGVTMGGPADYAFIACYRGLIEDVVQQGGDPGWFQPLPFYDLRRDIKDELDSLARAEDRDPDIAKSFSQFTRPGAHWLKRRVLENLNRDFFMAEVLQMPLSLDQLHLRVLKKKLQQQQSATNVTSTPESLVLEGMLENTKIPNLSNVPWSAIADVRVSGAWESFRQRLTEIAQRVAERYDPVGDAHEFREESKKYVSELWAREVKQWEENTYKNLLEAVTRTLGRAATVLGVLDGNPVYSWISFGSLVTIWCLNLKDRSIKSKHISSVIFTLEKAAG